MLVDIEKVKASERIRKDFGNLQELADDIKENGLINPPVVIPENDGTFTLLAGERRLRAMKLLGYKQVEVRTWGSLNEEQKLNIEISENEVRKDFSKAERIEYAKRLEKIESLKAKERQEATQFGNSTGVENFPPPQYDGKVRDIVAGKLNIGSGKQYEKEKYIVENADTLSPADFADWDEGKLSTNKAFMRIKEQLHSSENIISGYKMKLEKNNQEINDLKNKISNLARATVRTETITQEVDKPETIKRIKALEKQLVEKTEYGTKMYNQMIEKTKLLNTAMGESTNWQLTSHCSEITKKMLDFINNMAKYDYLAESFNEIPLATKKEYIRCISGVKTWADRILETIQTAPVEYASVDFVDVTENNQ